MTLSLMQFSSPGKRESGRSLLATSNAVSTSLVAPHTNANNETRAEIPLEDVGMAIAAHRVSMVYHTGNQSQTVLQDINLDIPQGTIQLLMGPSGSGKTTLLSILGGILSPTDGNVSLLGTDITQLSKRKLAQFRLQNIGFIFQGFNLFDALTAAENISVALKMKGLRSKQAKLEALYWLEQVGLAEKAHQLPKNLSGGQKQRVAIARALAGSPPIIMADEPTAALDSHSGQVVIEMLCDLAKKSNRTVLMVTHDSRIKSVADQVTYLEDGQLQPRNVTATHDLNFPGADTWIQSA